MNELEMYRQNIDEIDKQIIYLLHERFQVVEKIWDYKKKNNMEALQQWRFKEVLDTRKMYASELWIDSILIDSIWNNIHDYSLKLEK